MGYLTHQELALYSPQLRRAGSPQWQIGNQIKSFACFLWRTYPYNFTNNIPVTAPIRYFWNSICQDPPVNQPPTKPNNPSFTGGQCLCTVYTVNYTRTFSGGSPANSNANATGITGAVYGLRHTFEQGVSTNVVRSFILHDECVAGVPTGGTKLTSIGQSSGPTLGPNYHNLFFITSVVPTSGPDTCGNVDPGYPPNTPPSSQNFNVTINEDNDTSYNLVFNWNGDFNIPLKFTGPNVNVYLDFNGINFEWNNDFNLPDGSKNPFTDRPPIVRPPWSRPPGGGGSNPSPGDEGVEEQPPVDVTPVDPVEEEDGTDERILWIKIVILNPPPDRFVIRSVIPEDNTYFAGYLAWTKATLGGIENVSPEIPIRRETTIVRKPDEYSGYRVRATNTATLRVTTYTEKVT